MWIILIKTVLTLSLITTTFLICGFMFTGRGEQINIGEILETVDPFLVRCFGIGLCVSMSIFGSAVGIYTIGTSMMGIGVKKPHVKTKNLISIIFCEAQAVYGLIIGIVLCGYLDPLMDDENTHEAVYMTSYIIFGSGFSVGAVNVAASLAVGIIGSATALADGARPASFVKNLILEIFAGAIGLFGLIVGIYLTSRTAS